MRRVVSIFPVGRLWLALLVTSFFLGTPVGPVTAAGASLKISPPAGSYEVGALVDVSFIVDTGGEAINAVQADITFPADKLQVVNPVASTSFISIWVTPPTYSNTDGTIHFQGGIPNPGIKTSAGVISTVTFRIKAAGKAQLKYAPTSKVLRNDGEGTNILTSTGTAEYTMKLPPPAGPLVSSPTHRDPNNWYNNSSIQIEWQAIDEAIGYSFSFDQSSNSIPDDTVDTTTTSTIAKASGDGVWYFHIRAKTTIWGGVTSYPVQIDATPPAKFTPTFDRDILTTEDRGSLRWVTSDAASGIDHYEVKQVSTSGDQAGLSTLFVEVSSPYILPPLKGGDFEFIARAVDRAGNTTDGSAKLRVVTGGLPLLARIPILRNPAVANGALIGLAVLLMLSIGLIILRRIRLRVTFQHDLVALEHDARKKAEELQHELEELRRAQDLVQQDFGIHPPPVSPTGQISQPTAPPV